MNEAFYFHVKYEKYYLGKSYNSVRRIFLYCKDDNFTALHFLKLSSLLYIRIFIEHSGFVLSYLKCLFQYHRELLYTYNKNNGNKLCRTN